jgi:hypothetical protein
VPAKGRWPRLAQRMPSWATLVACHCHLLHSSLPEQGMIKQSCRRLMILSYSSDSWSLAQQHSTAPKATV